MAKYSKRPKLPLVNHFAQQNFLCSMENVIFMVAKSFASPVVFYSRLVFVIAAKTEML